MEIIDAGNHTSLIRLGSEFSDACETELFSLLDQSASRPDRWLFLDFSEVTFMYSSGINTLVKLFIRGRNSHVRVAATGLNQRLREIFVAAGLEQAYHITRKTKGLPVSPGLPDKPVPVNGADWAMPVKKLAVPQMPSEAINLNVNGRTTAGPLQGFGQLWEKTYLVDLSDTGLTPAQIIETLKKHFPLFQPEENRFYPSVNGIRPGEIILINARTPGGLVATGVRVLYAGETSFTFITPQGHPEAGWVTFKAFVEDGRTMMQIRGLARASDLVYEIAFRIAGSKLQQGIWTHVLESLARHTTSSGKVEFRKECLDGSLQWSRIFNVFQNAQILSILYVISHPFRKYR